MEIFKTIPSFPDYEISNFGRCRTKERLIRFTHSVTNKEHFRKSVTRFLKVQFNNRTSYKFVQLYLDKKMFNKTLHRLVAETFIENLKSLEVVNHKDGNKHNNTIENLEWCSDKYNHEHATKTGLKAKGIEIKSSKLDERSVLAIKYFINKGYEDKELSIAFKISRPTIALIRLGKIWKHLELTINL